MSITSFYAGPRFRTATHNISVCALMALVHAALTRQRTRQALARLDQQLLVDVNISRAEALTEAAKPFWRR